MKLLENEKEKLFQMWKELNYDILRREWESTLENHEKEWNESVFDEFCQDWFLNYADIWYGIQDENWETIDESTDLETIKNVFKQHYMDWKHRIFACDGEEDESMKFYFIKRKI